MLLVPPCLRLRLCLLRRHPARAPYAPPPPQVSLLAGWQNISELLLKNGASTAGVAGIKSALTCPDCKRLVAEYQL